MRELCRSLYSNDTEWPHTEQKADVIEYGYELRLQNEMQGIRAYPGIAKTTRYQ